MCDIIETMDAYNNIFVSQIILEYYVGFVAFFGHLNCYSTFDADCMVMNYYFLSFVTDLFFF